MRRRGSSVFLYPPLPGKVSARRETKDRRPLLSTPTFHAAAAVDSQEGSNEGGGGRLTEMKMAEGWHLVGGADDHTIVFAAQKIKIDGHFPPNGIFRFLLITAGMFLCNKRQHCFSAKITVIFSDIKIMIFLPLLHSLPGLSPSPIALPPPPPFSLI